MNQIVRRVAHSIAKSSNPDALPLRRHHAAGIFATSQVTLGFDPRIFFSWAVQPSYWAKGFRLMIFHSTSGFCPLAYPDDLNRHGSLIIETIEDADYEVRPVEGAHFYTFVLHRKRMLGLAEEVSIVRFSETIPSAKVAISRIRDKMELEELIRKQQLVQFEHEARLNEVQARRLRSSRELDDLKGRGRGRSSAINEELASIDEIINAEIAIEDKISALNCHPRFRSLKTTTQERIFKMINDRLDPGEISARREQRKS